LTGCCSRSRNRGPAIERSSDMRDGISKRMIDPQVLARAKDLQLIAKTVVEGFISGLHRSPYHGFSIDFMEYREYSPGDDIRAVDWKAYARTDRIYVKKYEGDTNTQLYILLDASKSMGYASGPTTKIDYARYLAASLAYFASRQKDACGLLTFDSEVREYTPPRNRHGHFLRILNHLEGLKLGDSTNLSNAMEKLSSLIRKRSLVVLISDFYQTPDDIVRGLRFLHHRGNDVVLFHILDPMELSLSLDQVSVLEDMESREQMSYVPELSLKEYLSRVEEHISRLRKESGDVSIDYEVLNTSEPLDRALHRYLNTRSRRY
jgi:uncharacterized protein (DUF58 family)